MTILMTAAVIICSWLIGSVPFAFIAVKISRKTDIRTQGSGNSGATNVFRLSGLQWAIPVFILDFLKGFLPVLIVLRSGFAFSVSAPFLAVLAGSAAFLGHLFPVFTGFRGGKGMATAAGILTALYPLLFPACLAVFLPLFLLTRKMSFASVLTALLLPLEYFLLVLLRAERIQMPVFIFICFASFLVIFKHKDNIIRLFKGTETSLF